MNKKSDLLENIKKLQDLKFYMFVESHYRLDFLKFTINEYLGEYYKINLVEEMIENKNMTIKEIAMQIVSKYKL